MSLSGEAIFEPSRPSLAEAAAVGEAGQVEITSRGRMGPAGRPVDEPVTICGWCVPIRERHHELCPQARR